MHDNVRPHATRVVTEHFEEINVTTLNWPARCPDLNPIEPVWDHLRWTRHQNRHPFQTLNKLPNVTLAWDDLKQQYIPNLIESRPRRLETVIKTRERKQDTKKLIERYEIFHYVYFFIFITCSININIHIFLFLSFCV